MLDRIPDLWRYEDQFFRTAGSFAQFEAFYLDGKELRRDTDYTVSEVKQTENADSANEMENTDGSAYLESDHITITGETITGKTDTDGLNTLPGEFRNKSTTRIDIPAATFEKAGEGSHTVAAVFRDSDGNFRLSAQTYKVDLSGKLRIDKSDVEGTIAVQYVPYTGRLKAIPDYENAQFTLAGESVLPDGLTLEPDGKISGAPLKVEDCIFTVELRGGDGETIARETITLNVRDNTDRNVETDTANNGYEVLERIPDMNKVTSSLQMTSAGPYEFFMALYLDGRKLIRDVEYHVYEGSTKNVIEETVTTALAEGDHTVSAEFEVHHKDGTTETQISAQNFHIGSKQPRNNDSGGGTTVSYYDIQLSTLSNGKVKLNTKLARSGTTVTITATPNAGFKVNQVQVLKSGRSGSVDVRDAGNGKYTFVMPQSRVTVKVSFAALTYRIAPIELEHGTLTVSPANARKGTRVTITAHPETGREASRFTAWDAEGKYLTVTDNGNGTASFLMPMSAVQVSARFDWARLADFADIDGSRWFFADAVWAYDYKGGLLRGVTDTQWDPDSPMTTLTSVLTLSRLAGYAGGAQTIAEEQSGVADQTVTQEQAEREAELAALGVEPDDPYVDEILWAKRHYLLSVRPFTRETITRGDLAMMLARFLDYEGVVIELPEEEVIFADQDRIAEMSAVRGEDIESAFRKLYAAGIFQGNSSGNMNPGGYTKRSHLAALLHRMSNFIIRYWEEKEKAA